jgi:hypothetical protein
MFQHQSTALAPGLGTPERKTDMKNQCLYPALAGVQSNKPLWSTSDYTKHTEVQPSSGIPPVVGLIVDLITALEHKHVHPHDLEEIVIPFIYTSPVRLGGQDHGWVQTEDLTIDALIHGQTSQQSSYDTIHKMMTNGGRSVIPGMLQDMPTLSHCIALWGYLALQDLLEQSHRTLQTSPLSRDLEACRNISRSFYRYIHPYRGHSLYDVGGLQGTPLSPRKSI